MKALIALFVMISSSWCLAKAAPEPKYQYLVSIVDSQSKVCEVEGVGMYINSKMIVSSPMHTLVVKKISANPGDTMTVRPWSDAYLLEEHDCQYLRVKNVTTGKTQIHLQDEDLSFRISLH